MEDYNPTRADARITLTSYEDPGETMHEALLNPASLPIDIEVAIGELNPVGASHTTLQYGHTKAMDTSLELYFSSQLQGRVYDKAYGTMTVPADVRQYVNWLASFCHASQAGRAPSPLLIIWPKVLNIVAVVRRYRAEYIRFARDAAPTAARVTLETPELRFSFKDAAEMRQEGWLRRDPLLTPGNSGRGMNLGG